MGCVEAPGKQFHRLHHVELEKQSPPSLEGGGVREGRGEDFPGKRYRLQRREGNLVTMQGEHRQRGCEEKRHRR